MSNRQLLRLIQFFIIILNVVIVVVARVFIKNISTELDLLARINSGINIIILLIASISIIFYIEKKLDR